MQLSIPVRCKIYRKTVLRDLRNAVSEELGREIPVGTLNFYVAGARPMPDAVRAAIDRVFARWEMESAIGSIEPLPGSIQAAGRVQG